MNARDWDGGVGGDVVHDARLGYVGAQFGNRIVVEAPATCKHAVHRWWDSDPVFCSPGIEFFMNLIICQGVN